MSNKTKNRKKSVVKKEKPLGQMLEIIYRARVEGSLEKIASIKEQLVHLHASADHGQLSSAEANTLSIDLQQELTKTICSLETWHFEMRNRNHARAA